MATSDRTGAVTVTIGGQVRFQMKSKKRIKEAFNENDRVVQVLADATDPTTLILIGRTAGTSRLELTDVDGGKESYLIVVQRDVEMLRNLIRKTLPTADDRNHADRRSGNQHHPLRLRSPGGRSGDRSGCWREALGLQVVVNTVTVGGGGNVPHVQLDLTLAKVDRDASSQPRGQLHHQRNTDFSVGSLLGGLTSSARAGGGGRGGRRECFPRSA